jgi:hypothetical protein
VLLPVAAAAAAAGANLQAPAAAAAVEQHSHPQQGRVVRHSLQAAAAAAAEEEPAAAAAEEEPAAAAAAEEPAAAAGEEHRPLAAARLVVLLQVAPLQVAHTEQVGPLQVAHTDTLGELPLDKPQAGMPQPEALGPHKQRVRLALLMLPVVVHRTPQEAARPAPQPPAGPLQPLRLGKALAHMPAGAPGRGRAAARLAAAAVGAACRGMLRPVGAHRRAGARRAQRHRAGVRPAPLEGVRRTCLGVGHRRGAGTAGRPLALRRALGAAELAGLGSIQGTCSPPRSWQVETAREPNQVRPAASPLIT